MVPTIRIYSKANERKDETSALGKGPYAVVGGRSTHCVDVTHGGAAENVCDRQETNWWPNGTRSHRIIKGFSLTQVIAWRSCIHFRSQSQVPFRPG